MPRLVLGAAVNVPTNNSSLFPDPFARADHGWLASAKAEELCTKSRLEMLGIFFVFLWGLPASSREQ